VTTESEAFDNWAAQFDHESDEYLDMGADQFFAAGFRAGLEHAAQDSALREQQGEHVSTEAEAQVMRNATHYVTKHMAEIAFEIRNPKNTPVRISELRRILWPLGHEFESLETVREMATRILLVTLATGTLVDQAAGFRWLMDGGRSDRIWNHVLTEEERAYANHPAEAIFNAIAREEATK